MKKQDPMVEVFIFETQQLLENLENILLQGEKNNRLNEEQINEIFRVMHTIKGSAAMMSFDDLAHIAHAVEDLFSQIREKKARSGDWKNIFDIVLISADKLKDGIEKIQSGQEPGADGSDLVDKIHGYLELLSKRKIVPAEQQGEADRAAEEETADLFADDSSAPYYKAKIIFEAGCQMENLRAFGVVNALEQHCLRIASVPEDLMAETASDAVRDGGLVLYIQSQENPDSIKKILDEVMFLQSSSLIPIAEDSEELPAKIRPRKQVSAEKPSAEGDTAAKQPSDTVAKQNFISVNINKLDKLMDLVGEIVTTESMVTKNPEVTELKVESFERSGQQLRKLINELQEIVTSIRMVPISTTFHKMQRIVRDMSKKVSKEVNLVIIGEETEVDKNIIDQLSDPLMHLIRNAVDHGIETPEDRLNAGKPAAGRVTLEARGTGGDVLILVNDDGKGLNRTKLIQKAIDKGITTKSESEISDKEAFSFIFHPGFSTKDSVTEFSGRGVGMDVVRKNIDKVNGSIAVESTPGQGTSVQIKIPLTLAIIEGMKLRVGNLIFIVPMLSIQQSFKPSMSDVILDPDGNEMIMIRKECYSIVRLHRLFGIESEFTELSDGILVMVKTDTNAFCMFVDQLIGEQHAVIKPLPVYIQKHNEGMNGLVGCAILGDGSISLIIDINHLTELT